MRIEVTFRLKIFQNHVNVKSCYNWLAGNPDKLFTDAYWSGHVTILTVSTSTVTDSNVISISVWTEMYSSQILHFHCSAQVQDFYVVIFKHSEASPTLFDVNRILGLPN